VDVPPCIATTYSLIPVDDDEAKAITDGTLLLKPEDAVNFTFLPHKPLTNSICVISWLKECQRACRFMSLNRISDLSEEVSNERFCDAVLLCSIIITVKNMFVYNSGNIIDRHRLFNDQHLH
jgi:hypothetical protein